MGKHTKLGSVWGAMVTMVAVVGLYAFPVVLSSILDVAHPPVHRLSVEGPPVFSDVVFMPLQITPTEDSSDVDVSPEDTPHVPTQPKETIKNTEPPPPPQAPAPALAVTTNHPKARIKRVAQAKTLRPARHRRPRTKRKPRPPPTKKQLRARERRKKRAARIAKQRQCSELIDDIVQVDELEWWVGREIVNCYRGHIQQFDDLGGMWWAEQNGERIGVRLHIPRKSKVAHAAGFKNKDIILSINGIKIRSWTASPLLVMQLMGGKVRIKRLRKGEEQTLVIRVVGDRKLAKGRIKAERWLAKNPRGKPNGRVVSVRKSR